MKGEGRLEVEAVLVLGVEGVTGNGVGGMWVGACLKDRHVADLERVGLHAM